MVSGASHLPLVKHMAAAAAAAVKTAMGLDVASTVEIIKCVVLLQQHCVILLYYPLDQTLKLLSRSRNHTVGNSNVSCFFLVNLRPIISGKNMFVYRMEKLGTIFQLFSSLYVAL